MALNCRAREGGEPCGTCESCERIWSGRTSLDVVEIDAASNRGVDDARELRERAMYAPSEESRYKVYIIDEAHMLTREAWNAFLKILEEPPPRVVFVLATTEPGKILQAAPPILSRCQRFDFRRISAEQIRARLSEVLDAEKVEAEEAALVTISRKAEGALRDALSSLDQVLAFSEAQITVTDVRRVLGLVEEEAYLELLDTLADHRAADVFGYVEKLVDEGYDLEEFQRGFGESLRLLLRARLDESDSLAGLAPHLSQRYSDMAKRFSAGDLIRMLSALAELDTDGRFRKSEQQRILIEVMLVRFAMLDRTVDLERLIEAAGSAGGRSEASSPEGHNPIPAKQAGRATKSSKPAAEPRSTGAVPLDAGSTSTEAPNDSLSAAREAWLGLITDGKVLRPGQGIALRAVQLTQLGDNGELVVSAGSETPSGELLAESVTRRRLEQELSARLGRPIRIRLTEPGVAAPPRVNEETARKQRLDRLVEGDQGLQQLVEKLDLEMMD